MDDRMRTNYVSKEVAFSALMEGNFLSLICFELALDFLDEIIM